MYTYDRSKEFLVQSIVVDHKVVEGIKAKELAHLVLKRIYREVSKIDFYNASCFGVPVGGLNPGQVVTDNEAFVFTLWDSGGKVEDQ